MRGILLDDATLCRVVLRDPSVDTHMTRLLLPLALVAAASSTSLADDEPAPFEAIEQFGRIGIGMVRYNDATGMDHRYGFDGSLRFGKVWRATDLVRPGFFFELRTVNFDTFEPAIGPQTQFRLGKTLALQLRGGVGAEANGRSFALGSVAVGTSWLGMSVTARRMAISSSARP
jgi:hypothetical protein